jgi:hypothetical protein
MCKNSVEYKFSVINTDNILDFNMNISYANDEIKNIYYLLIYVEKILYQDEIKIDIDIESPYIHILFGINKEYMEEYELIIPNNEYHNDIELFNDVEQKFIKKNINTILLNITPKLNIIELLNKEKLL